MYYAFFNEKKKFLCISFRIRKASYTLKDAFQK